ncbi:MAG TPA: hypothetical protein VFA27_09895 [Vicinamibacterales bacterium]|nr:hypothetical protein [Vicinamibacterales bacterium]
MRRLLVGAAIVSMWACNSVAPVKVQGGEVCYRCRRVIQDTKLAAETIDGKLIWKFRSTGCVSKYLADHPQDKSIVFVTDYKTGNLVPPERCAFVPTMNRDNGEKDFIAFADRAAANAEAFSRGVKPVDWNAVMAQARDWSQGRSGN